MTQDCLFCKIAKGEIPSDFVYEDDSVVAFRDINPQAPLHVLVIPRQHVEKISQLEQNDTALVARMIAAANCIAAEQNIAENGYRLVLNCGADGGQEVYHIHLHLLGGRKMNWPPG